MAFVSGGVFFGGCCDSENDTLSCYLYRINHSWDPNFLYNDLDFGKPN